MIAINYAPSLSSTKNLKGLFRIYNTQKHPVGVEAFAHFTSILVVNKQLIEAFKSYFPKSFVIFEEILDL